MEILPTLTSSCRPCTRIFSTPPYARTRWLAPSSVSCLTSGHTVPSGCGSVKHEKQRLPRRDPAVFELWRPVPSRCFGFLLDLAMPDGLVAERSLPRSPSFCALAAALRRRTASSRAASSSSESSGSRRRRRLPFLPPDALPPGESSGSRFLVHWPRWLSCFRMISFHSGSKRASMSCLHVPMRLVMKNSVGLPIAAGTRCSSPVCECIISFITSRPSSSAAKSRTGGLMAAASRWVRSSASRISARPPALSPAPAAAAAAPAPLSVVLAMNVSTRARNRV